MKTLFLSLTFLLSSSSLLAVTYEGQLEVEAEEGLDLIHSTAFGNRKSRSFSPRICSPNKRRLFPSQQYIWQ